MSKTTHESHAQLAYVQREELVGEDHMSSLTREPLITIEKHGRCMRKLGRSVLYNVPRPGHLQGLTGLRETKGTGEITRGHPPCKGASGCMWLFSAHRLSLILAQGLLQLVQLV